MVMHEDSVTHASELNDQAASTYIELHRDTETGGIVSVSPQPADGFIWATEGGNHSMLDELRLANDGNLPPGHNHAMNLDTETVRAKGHIEEMADGSTLYINHIRTRNGEKRSEIFEELCAVARQQGIEQIAMDEAAVITTSSVENDSEREPITVIKQLPDTEISEAVFSGQMTSGVVKKLTPESERIGPKLEAVQARSKIHQPVLEVAGFDARGFAPGLKAVLFTKGGEPVLGGIRYVVDDAALRFQVSLVSPTDGNPVQQQEVLETAANALYRKLDLDSSYSLEFTIGDSRGVTTIDPDTVMHSNKA